VGSVANQPIISRSTQIRVVPRTQCGDSNSHPVSRNSDPAKAYALNRPCPNPRIGAAPVAISSVEKSKASTYTVRRLKHKSLRNRRLRTPLYFPGT